MAKPAEEFVKDFLAHAAYDPAKAHAYYEAHKKLKGRKPGQKSPSSTPPTNKHRSTAIANRAAAKVGPQRAAAIQKLADEAKARLDKLTEEFRNWVNAHPKASPTEVAAQRRKAVDEKNKIVSDLKDSVAKISAAASSKKPPKTATQGRHH